MEETHDSQLQNRTVNRRRLLRRAGTVAVGVAGAGVASTMVASPAQAAPGGFDSNTLTGPAVTAANTATTTESGVPVIGPQLQLVPPNNGGFVITEQAPKGSMAMDDDGYIWVVPEDAGFTYRDFIHTTGNSNMTVAINPIRIFDTDTSKMPTGRDRVLNPSGAFNGNKLRANKWIFIDLTGLVDFGLGVFCSAVVVTPANGGYISVGPYVGSAPAKPGWSSLNYNAGLTASGLVFSGIGGDVDPGTAITTDVIAVYSNQEVRVLIDVSGFVVDSAGRVSAPLAGSSLRAGEDFASARRALVNRYAPRV